MPPSSLPDDPRLATIAEQIERTGLAANLADPEWRLVWVSRELKSLLDEDDEERLGYGKHLLQALIGESWVGTVTEDTPREVLAALGPLMLATPGGREQLLQISGEGGVEFIEQFEAPGNTGGLATYRMDYVRGDLPPVPINCVVFPLREESGERIGTVQLFGSALPATLLDLVVRGDPAMFERMARLIAPGKHQAAVLFADLQASGALSRRLPSAANFALIRSFTTAIDEVVIGHSGIVGKHVGDGVTAFFLAEDLGSASAAARAAIESARQISEAFRGAVEELGEQASLIEPEDLHVNIGVHWGGALYMGQVVTGGRLEVTALGDEVNECARIQEVARDGVALGSKPLIERLDADDAEAVGVDPDAVGYRTVAELGASEKAVRDAGGIAVTPLS